MSTMSLRVCCERCGAWFDLSLTFAQPRQVASVGLRHDETRRWSWRRLRHRTVVRHEPIVRM